jgi:hypothetical protein
MHICVFKHALLHVISTYSTCSLQHWSNLFMKLCMCVCVCVSKRLCSWDRQTQNVAEKNFFWGTQFHTLLDVFRLLMDGYLKPESLPFSQCAECARSFGLRFPNLRDGRCGYATEECCQHPCSGAFLCLSLMMLQRRKLSGTQSGRCVCVCVCVCVHTYLCFFLWPIYIYHSQKPNMMCICSTIQRFRHVAVEAFYVLRRVYKRHVARNCII